MRCIEDLCSVFQVHILLKRIFKLHLLAVNINYPVILLVMAIACPWVLELKIIAWHDAKTTDASKEIIHKSLSYVSLEICKRACLFWIGILRKVVSLLQLYVSKPLANIIIDFCFACLCLTCHKQQVLVCIIYASLFIQWIEVRL